MQQRLIVIHDRRNYQLGLGQNENYHSYNYITNLIVSGLGNCLHVDNLSSVILNSGQHDDGDAVTLLLNRIKYVFGSQQLFSLAPDIRTMRPQEIRRYSNNSETNLLLLREPIVRRTTH